MLKEVFLAFVITAVPAMGFAQGQKTAVALRRFSPDGTALHTPTH